MRARDLAAVAVLLAPLHDSARGQCQPSCVPGSGLPAGAIGHANVATRWDPDGPGPAPAALVVGGQFAVPGPAPLANLAVCDLATGAWSTLPGWSFGEVTALAAMPNGDLVAAGTNQAFPAPIAHTVARWNGSAWQPIATASAGIYAMSVAANGDVFVGGDFVVLAGLTALGVARWDGACWQALGGGLGAFVFVRAMVTMPNGDLVVGGLFGGGTPLPGIARWDGTTWSPVGSALPGGSSGVVGNLLVLPNGDLLATRSLTNGIARWDGVAWTLLGSSPYFQSPLQPGPLAVLPDGDVIVGGLFAQTGPSLLLRWNGSVWNPLAAVSPQEPQSAAVPLDLEVLPDGDVVVVGRIGGAAGLPAFAVARLRSPCAATVVQHGPGCASSGGSNTLTAQSLPWTGSTFRARGEGLPGLALVSVVYGLSPLSLPLASVLPQALPGCDLLTAPDFVTFAVCTNGTVDTALAIPDTFALFGLSFYHQLNPFEIDPSLTILAVTASNALRMQIGVW